MPLTLARVRSVVMDRLQAWVCQLHGNTGRVGVGVQIKLRVANSLNMERSQDSGSMNPTLLPDRNYLQLC